MPNEKKLRARIIEMGYTIKSLAKTMKLSAYTLGRKISGKAPMSIDEAFRLMELLKIPETDFSLYFSAIPVA